ncbi:MAG: arginine--tRNA ligase, partial [Clostridia bacterium]|nr:arginine--tRNA ligase [Clostridia bacterium]
MDYKKRIANALGIDGFSAEEIEGFICLPPDSSLGDFALPCFRFSKALRKPPTAIAEELKASFKTDEYIEEVSVVGGYLNFRVNRKGHVLSVLKEVFEKGEKYGASEEGAGKTVCIDYSSINIAKPFHIGHLSTTVLGAALYRLYKFSGYNAVGINHLGDYGTQFGKLIVAYRLWGDRTAVEKGGVRELMRLYVKYHDEAEKHPEMDDEARSEFKKIENNDCEALALFNFFKELTLKDVGKIYERLNVSFDSYAGESFYNDKMDVVVEELRNKGLLTKSEGAEIVDLSAYDMPPCIILRSDGASLYATRDLAAAIYRKNTYDFYKNLYVVAYQQNLHFRQIFKVLELMGKEWAKDCVHVAYGMVSMEDGAMSTRHGKVVFLEDVLDKCVEKCLAIITEKNPDLPDRERIAEQVGTGAVIFGALSSSKIKDMVFSYDKVLNFDGETGPY